jgi:hypothetical protein
MMRKSGNEQHYFTVRGRGFDHKQWRAVTELAEAIVVRAKKAGILADFEADARRIIVSSTEKGVTPLVIWRKGEPNIPKEVITKGQYDAVIQSVLTATKKVAPDIFEMVSPDGRDYRRLLAAQNGGDLPEVKEIAKKNREEKDRAFLQAVKRQHWPHPETKNQVEFVSLPKAEQTQIRHRWDAEYGRRYDEMAERATKKIREAEKAKTEAQRDKEKAQDAAKSVGKTKTQAQPARSATTMNEDSIRKAAIRVAASTEDSNLKKALLELLRDTVAAAPEGAPKEAKDDKEKESRHEEGKSVDVGDYLKSKGHDEDSAKWEKHEGEMGKKSSPAVVFPELYESAWQHVIAFSKGNPESKTASGSTADRVTAADHLAKKWIQDAIKHPGRVHEYLGVPEGKDIPMGKINTAIEKVKGTGNKSLLSALQLAKRLKGMNKKKAAAAPALVSVQTFPETYRLASQQVIAFLKKQPGKTASDLREQGKAMSYKLAKGRIQEALKNPGDARAYLKFSNETLVATLEKAKVEGNVTLVAQLELATRLKAPQAA